MTVRCDGKSKIGQRKDRPALAYAATIEVAGFDLHTRLRVSVSSLRKLDPS